MSPHIAEKSVFETRSVTNVKAIINLVHDLTVPEKKIATASLSPKDLECNPGIRDNLLKIDSGTICRIILGKLSCTFRKLGFGKMSRIRFVLLRSVRNRLGTSPHLIWGHIRCMQARPHRRKDQLPLRLLRDLRSRYVVAPVRRRLAKWERVAVNRSNFSSRKDRGRTI